MRKLLLILVGISVLSAPTAQADTASIQRALDLAPAYWEAQGVSSRCAVISWKVEEIADPNVAAYGWYAPECRIQFDPSVLNYNWAVTCRLVLHEVGHTNQLGHSEVTRFTIMDGEGPLLYATRTPFCDGAAKIGRLNGGSTAARKRLRLKRLHLARRFAKL